jgi:hypothetical protein
MNVQKKLVDEKTEGFSFRVKISDYEVEITGNHEEVMKTVERLPDLITNISKAFENVKPKTVATITLKTAEATEATKSTEVQAKNYPKVSGTDNAEEAVLRILESEWGKWRPRTLEELKESFSANDLKYSERILSSTLDALSKKGLVKRWNTNTGFVYILAEKKRANLGGE